MVILVMVRPWLQRLYRIVGIRWWLDHMSWCWCTCTCLGHTCLGSDCLDFLLGSLYLWASLEAGGWIRTLGSETEPLHHSDRIFGDHPEPVSESLGPPERAACRALRADHQAPGIASWRRAKQLDPAGEHHVAVHEGLSRGGAGLSFCDNIIPGSRCSGRDRHCHLRCWTAHWRNA